MGKKVNEPSVFCDIMDLKGHGCSSLRGDRTVNDADEAANEIADF